MTKIRRTDEARRRHRLKMRDRNHARTTRRPPEISLPAGRYTGAWLRAVRTPKGVGRPVP